MNGEERERSSEDYEADVEDKGYYWRVTLINKKTGSPKVFVNVEKSEFPSKQSAITYLTRRYETQSRKKTKSSSKIKRKSSKKYNEIEDLMKASKQESVWARTAKLESVDEEKRSKKWRARGYPEFANELKWDAKVAKAFSILRDEQADIYKNLAKEARKLRKEKQEMKKCGCN